MLVYPDLYIGLGLCWSRTSTKMGAGIPPFVVGPPNRQINGKVYLDHLAGMRDREREFRAVILVFDFQWDSRIYQRPPTLPIADGNSYAPPPPADSLLRQFAGGKSINLWELQPCEPGDPNA